MKKLAEWHIIFSLVVIALLSCSKHSDINTSELDEQFSNAAPLSDMNKSLQIVVNDQRAIFKPGSEIELTIYNKSPYSLFFDNKTHVMLLGNLDDLHWTEIKNAITYSATMILSPEGAILLDRQYTSVKPVLDQTDFDSGGADILLRIVIVGEIVDGDARTGRKVGAFVDVILKP